VAEVRNNNLITDNWRLCWRRRLFEWEQMLHSDLLDLLNPITLRLDEVDRWGWVPETGADFTVKSTYRMVSELSTRHSVVSPWNASLFSRIWKCPASSICQTQTAR
jgi:hypothetical protein